MKEKKSMVKLQGDNRNLFISTSLSQLCIGISMTVVGSILPYVKAEYGLSYSVSGMMMSLQSVGYFVTGLVAAFMPKIFGPKGSYLGLGSMAFLGFLMIIFTGNPFLLLMAMFMTGITKGAGGYFSNQFVCNMTESDAGALNLMQAFFAVGACLAPLIVMFCGSAWRMALAIIIAFGVIFIGHGLTVRISEDAYHEEPQENVGAGYAFFKTKTFWICIVMLGAYLAFEASVMGWLVTFLTQKEIAGDATIQMLSTAMWISLLIGRLSAAKLAEKFSPKQLLLGMAVGMLVFFAFLLWGGNLIIVTIGTVGVGLSMAGIYGTAVANTGDMISRYPMCMSMVIIIPGIISAIVPSIVGNLADAAGVQTGMTSLYVVVAIFAAVTLWDLLSARR